MIFSYFRVNDIMTWPTKSLSVRYFISKFWVFRPRLFMMSNQLFSRKYFETMLAGILISVMNFSFPNPILIIRISFSSSSVLIIPRTFSISRIIFSDSSLRKTFCISKISTFTGAILSILLFYLIRIFFSSVITTFSLACYNNAHQYELYNTLFIKEGGDV